MESDLESSEREETPKPSLPSVQPGDSKPSAGGQVDADGLVETISQRVIDALEKEVLPSLTERAMQSTKDRRFRPLAELGEDGIDALKSFKRYLDKYNGDEEEAIRQMRIDATLGQEAPSPSVVGATGSTLEGRMDRFARRILSTAGLDLKDPRYEEWVTSYRFVSEDTFYDDLEANADRWRTQSLKQTESVSGASTAPAEGSFVSSEDPDELAAQLERLQHPRPGEPGITHPDNIKQRQAIRDKLKALTPQRPDIK
jgi:hypothetical protein